MNENSAKDNWSERRKKYTHIREQELTEEIEDLFQDLNKRGIHEMDEFLNDLQELKKDIMTKYRNGEYKASYVLRIFKDYISCYRQATEIYYINTRHNLIPNEQENNKEVNDKKLQNFGKIINGA